MRSREQRPVMTYWKQCIMGMALWIQAFHRKLHDVIAFRSRAVLIHARVHRALALLTKYACFAMFCSHLKLYSNLPVSPVCRGTVVPELYTTRIYYVRDLGRKRRQTWNWDRIQRRDGGRQGFHLACVAGGFCRWAGKLGRNEWCGCGGNGASVPLQLCPPLQTCPLTLPLTSCDMMGQSHNAIYLGPRELRLVKRLRCSSVFEQNWLFDGVRVSGKYI